ncbi:MAG: hypothetical protein DI585_01055 [Pseudomonas fluorescens]|nr:MAG: hypothetical protein DI585_01055 [Pseudomonas fluorescens]
MKIFSLHVLLFISGMVWAMFFANFYAEPVSWMLIYGSLLLAVVSLVMVFVLSRAYGLLEDVPSFALPGISLLAGLMCAVFLRDDGGLWAWAGDADAVRSLELGGFAVVLVMPVVAAVIHASAARPLSR